MKSIILSTALILGATAPVFADTYNAPGIANATAAQAFANIALESDDGNTRLNAHSSVRKAAAQSSVAMSTSNVANGHASDQFTRIALESDDGNTRLLAGNTRTLFNAGPVNARAAAIFAAIAAETDGNS